MARSLVRATFLLYAMAPHWPRRRLDRGLAPCGLNGLFSLLISWRRLLERLLMLGSDLAWAHTPPLAPRPKVQSSSSHLSSFEGILLQA